MVNKFLELGFKNMGQFCMIKNELSFEYILQEYDPSNMVWVVATDKETLYVGKTISPIKIVLKDMLKANKNRATRNRVNALVEEYSRKYKVYFLVGDADVYSKQNLIKKFVPIGNINGIKKK